MTKRPDSGEPEHTNLENEVTQTCAADAPQRLPKQIGKFHVKGVLASGGMGVVYRAVQDQPRRTVAVKVMKQGIASRSAMRRFEYESQVLARLHHPSIAQVFEAGTYDDGSGPVPYYAMEYIPNAKPITQYANEKALGTHERVALFAKVCDAVYHGHQKGIIHRDLKPGNILVDPQGDVKIIDFGVARGTDSDLALTTLQTDVGQLIGTLQYMSPEQCEGDPNAIDARSDVYALGVVLFELLSGQLPYRVKRNHILDSARVIKEDVPTRLTDIDKTLRGDVETIVMTALEKDRDRRYQSAADFARDIRAYLDGQAIHARPPSTVYQLRLFARRHRSGLGLTAAVGAVAVVAAFIIIGLYGRQLEAQDAVAAALERATAAEKAAAASLPEGLPADRKPADLLGKNPPDFSFTTMDGKPVGTAEFPNYKATVLNFVAPECPFCVMQVPMVEEVRKAYESKGVRFVNASVRLWKDIPAEDAANIFKQVGSHIEFACLKGGFREVSDMFHVRGYPCLFILDSKGKVTQVSTGYQPDLVSRLKEHLDALIQGVPTREERLAEAEKLHRQTLENNKKTLGEGHRDTLRAMENLAGTLSEEGQLEEAEELYRDLREIRSRVLGETDPQTLEAMYKLGEVLQARGDSAGAESIHRQTLELRRQVLGPNHPDTRASMAQLGLALHRQGKAEGARPYIAELIEQFRQSAQVPDANLHTLNDYAWLLLTCVPEDLRDPETALSVAREAVRLSGRHKKEYLNTLARAQWMTGDRQAAIETQKEAVALVWPGDFKARNRLEEALVTYLTEAGEVAGIEKVYRDSVAYVRANVPVGSPAVGVALARLGGFLLEQERYSEAESVLREALSIGKAALPEGFWGITITESAVGAALAGQGRFEAAEPLVLNGYLRLKDNPGAPPEMVHAALQHVVDLYTAWGKPDLARQYQAELPTSSESPSSAPTPTSKP